MTDLIVSGSIVSALPFRTGSFRPDFFCIGYQIKAFYSMITSLEDENNSFKDVSLFFLIQICYTEAILIKNIRILLNIIAFVWKT